jgi:ABC-2 type transport system permease protein
LGAYWASFIAVASDPEGAWARLVSVLPPTAPFAMPGRIALGVAEWWEPVLAVILALAAIAALVVFAGRMYTGAILHIGSRLRLRDAWNATTRPTGATKRWAR